MVLATITSNSAHILLLEATSVWGTSLLGRLEGNSAAVGVLRSDTVRLPRECRPTHHHNFTATVLDAVRNIRQALRWQ